MKILLIWSEHFFFFGFSVFCGMGHEHSNSNVFIRNLFYAILWQNRIVFLRNSGYWKIITRYVQPLTVCMCRACKCLAKRKKNVTNFYIGNALTFFLRFASNIHSTSFISIIVVSQDCDSSSAIRFAAYVVRFRAFT